eukprot:jgi/Tetstr1/426239/TSEL_016559.t1
MAEAIAIVAGGRAGRGRGRGRGRDRGRGRGRDGPGRGDPDEHLPSETVTDKARRLVRAEFDLMRDFLKYHAVSDEDVAKLLVIGGTAGSGELGAAKYENGAAPAAGGSAGDSVGDATSIAPILVPKDLS